MSCFSNDFTGVSHEWLVRVAERESGFSEEHVRYQRNGRKRLLQLGGLFGPTIHAFQTLRQWDEVRGCVALLAVNLAGLVYCERGPEIASDAATAVMCQLGFTVHGDVRKLHRNLRDAIQRHDVERIAKLLGASFQPPKGEREPAWSAGKNARRCDLIDKEIEGTITPVEKMELDTLQRQMLAYRRQIAPLPLDDARKLHQELLDRKFRKGE